MKNTAREYGDGIHISAAFLVLTSTQKLLNSVRCDGE